MRFGLVVTDGSLDDEYSIALNILVANDAVPTNNGAIMLSVVVNLPIILASPAYGNPPIVELDTKKTDSVTVAEPPS